MSIAKGSFTLVALMVAAGWASPGAAQQPAAESPATVTLTAQQLFAFADEARGRRDFEAAETAYRALAGNSDLEFRTEARFRLALMLADELDRPRDAAVLLRQILDEKPDAARVRVELARIQVSLGNYGEAERELRAAQAAGLPPQVEQMVRFYAAALNARKPLGGSLQVAIAPDSNINRATNSDTLETIIGDFDLSEDAQARSGIGLSVRGQAYFREGLEPGVELLVQASGLGHFYGRGEFDDYVLALQAGPEFRLGADRLSLSATANQRWFGRSPYSFGYGVVANFSHPMGEKAQLGAEITAIRTDDKLNPLRDARHLSGRLRVDRAFSARLGGGASLSARRNSARDPGHSTTSGGLDAYVFREFGQTTLVASAGFDHLEADERIFLYPRRRVDDRIELKLSGTFRALRLGHFAPLASVAFENADSSVEIYDYRKVRVELGITAAF